MAGDSKKLQPIIIKKIKKGGHGHHGGAWKIAYADFVTAMMAFFLLMWLLGSTTEGDKKGIADYFSSPLKIALLSSGSGAGDASHVIKGGGQDLTRTTGQVKRGEIAADRAAVNIKALKAEQIRAEIARLEDLKKKVEQKIKANSRLAPISSQIRLDMTADGLRIQIVDEQNRPMFDSGSAAVQPYMRELLREIGSVLADVPNRLTLEGHTDAQPFSAGERGYSNWELSADRANASRRELLAGGLPEDRVLRVQGLASSVLFDRGDPLNPVNRRISIIVMNREAEERFFRSSPDAPEGAASAIADAVAAPANTAAPAAATVTAPTTSTSAASPLAQPVDIVPQVRPSLTDNLRKP
jgi:chemotaxis protein MotB